MHMNIEMTLRFSITPTTPIVNSTAESARYHESCGSIGFESKRLSLLRAARLRFPGLFRLHLSCAIELGSDRHPPGDPKHLWPGLDVRAQRRRAVTTTRQCARG